MNTNIDSFVEVEPLVSKFATAHSLRWLLKKGGLIYRTDPILEFSRIKGEIRFRKRRYNMICLLALIPQIISIVAGLISAFYYASNNRETLAVSLFGITLVFAISVFIPSALLMSKCKDDNKEQLDAWIKSCWTSAGFWKDVEMLAHNIVLDGQAVNVKESLYALEGTGAETESESMPSCVIEACHKWLRKIIEAIVRNDNFYSIDILTQTKKKTKGVFALLQEYDIIPKNDEIGNWYREAQIKTQRKMQTKNPNPAGSGS